MSTFVGTPRTQCCPGSGPILTSGSDDTLTLTTFTYKELASTKHVRLIELLPGYSHESLNCKLTPFPFDTLPSYQALSYTWGTSLNAHTISIDGLLFGISSNVHDFLHRFRHPSQSKYVWIDAICINQTDEEEKATQILIMGDIYQRASNVVVWLGESPDAHAVTNLMRRLYYQMGDVSPFWVVGPLLRFLGAAWTTFKSVTPEICHKMVRSFGSPTMILWAKYYRFIPWQMVAKLLTPITSLRCLLTRSLPENKDIAPEWHPFITLLHHPWFDRIWIIQEIFFATSITVMYGSEEIPFDAFRKVVDTICSYLPQSISTLSSAEFTFCRRSLPSQMIHFRQVASMRVCKHLGDVRPSIFELLLRFSRCQASVPRDKIFALLGLSHEAARDEMMYGGLLRLSPSTPTTIDYKRSNREVFVETSQNMLTRETSAFRIPLDILPLAGIGHQRNVPDLPSWAVDWGAVPQAYTLAYHLGGDVLSYRAAGRSSDPYFYNSPEGRTLCEKASGVPAETQNLFGMLPGMSTSPYVCLGPVPDSIAVKGNVAAVVRFTSDIWNSDFEGEPEKSLQESKTWREEAWQLASMRVPDPYLTGEILPEAFWRTTIGDRTPTSRPAPQDYLQLANDLQIHQGILENRLKGEDFDGDIKKYLIEDYPGPMLGDIQEQILDSFALPFAIAMNQASLHRRFCVTREGFMGLVPAGTEEGDLVVIIEGAQTPFLLRTMKDRIFGRNTVGFQLVGECYMHGMMDGERVTEEKRVFLLV